MCHVLLWLFTTVNLLFHCTVGYIPDRYRSDAEQINPFFSHFTHFDYMVHPASRHQRSGFTSNPLLESPDRLRIDPDTEVNVSYLITHYIKRVYWCLMQPESPLSGDFTYYEYLHSSIHLNGSAMHGSPLNEFYVDVWANKRFALDKQKFYTKPLNYRSDSHVHILKSWRFVFLTALSSSMNWFTVIDHGPVNFGYLSKTHDEWSILFLYEMCRTLLESPWKRLKIPADYCPNPCIDNPCTMIQFTASDQCVAFGHHANQFYCMCQLGYVWVNSTGDSAGYCLRHSKCQDHCDTAGTMRCDIIESSFMCVCHDSHMGPKCNMLRNPCVEMTIPEELPGNEACNTGRGGRCNGTIGSKTYHCICPTAYMNDVTYSQPNCLALRDRCESTICIHGDCLSSMDGQETMCLCPEEMYGEQCQFFRGKWAQWSPWSACFPACGAVRPRTRTRTRGCLGEKCQGGAGHIEVEFCRHLPCPDELLVLSRQGREEEFSQVDIQMLLADTARYVKFVSAVGQTLLLMACIFSAVVATIMVVIVHCL